MTATLERAFAEAAKLPPPEQDLLAELAAENAFDCALESSGEPLAALARAALEEDRGGRTAELSPQQL
jgi:hypothetical protein